MADTDGKEQEADFVTIMSSEMIADVMQDYFNKHMYKRKVAIVDLKPTESGYMFSLAFTPQVVSTPTVKVKPFETLQGPPVVYTASESNGNAHNTMRDSKGKFTSGNSKQKVKK